MWKTGEWNELVEASGLKKIKIAALLGGVPDDDRELVRRAQSAFEAGT